MSSDTLVFLLPEIVLILAASLVYVVGAFVERVGLWTWVAIAAIAASAATLPVSAGVAQAGNSLTTDGLAFYIRAMALVMGLLLVLLSARSADVRLAAECVGSLLLTVAGTMLVAAAGDLVLLFVGLELISIPTYVLLYLGRGSTAARESAAKYFFLSILSSALLLYGFSFVYGVGGSTELIAVRERITQLLIKPTSFLELASLATVLLFAGLGFKIAAVPFHFYAPDVYQGTNHANAALLSVLPKIAGLVALVRIVAIALPGDESTGWRLAMILGALTMTVGNVLALWQDNLRRMLAYSSIANVGYMLIGLAVGLAAANPAGTATFDGIGAMFFYLAVYSVATLGTFAALIYLGRPDRPIQRVDDLAGLSRTEPLMAFCLAVAMFSLTGIPPLAGFWGKFTLFFGALTIPAEPSHGAINVWFAILALVGVINAAISAGYYLRVVAVSYFRPPRAVPPAGGGAGPWLAAVLCAALVIGLGVVPRPLYERSNTASRQARAVSSPPPAQQTVGLND